MIYSKPFYIKLLQYVYLLLVINALIVPVSYEWYMFIPVFFLMWVTYGIFTKGAIKESRLNQNIKDRMSCKNLRPVNHDRLFVFFVLFMVVFMPLYIKFYTGANAITLLLNFRSMTSGADSNYVQYYEHFAENNLGDFTLAKAPYVILYGVTKLIFIAFCFYYISFTKHLKRRNIFLLSILFLLYFVQGVSRGTSFENFELLIITIVAYLLRIKLIDNKDFFSSKQMIIVVGVGLLGIAYFIINKSMRYSDNSDALMLRDITDTLTYNPRSPIMQFAPFLGNISMNLAGYFTFGLYFTSVFFWKCILTPEGTVAFIVPFSASALFSGEAPRMLAMKNGIDCGVCWDPDFTSFMYTFGLPLLLFIIYYLGRLSFRFYAQVLKNRDVGYAIGLFLITYEMISLFIGNFLVISSSNKMCLFFTAYLIWSGKFMKYRIISK